MIFNKNNPEIYCFYNPRNHSEFFHGFNSTHLWLNIIIEPIIMIQNLFINSLYVKLPQQFRLNEKGGAFKMKCEYILALFPVLVVWKK